MLGVDPDSASAEIRQVCSERVRSGRAEVDGVNRDVGDPLRIFAFSGEERKYASREIRCGTDDSFDAAAGRESVENSGASSTPPPPPAPHAVRDACGVRGPY